VRGQARAGAEHRKMRSVGKRNTRASEEKQKPLSG
jgi:hypothetical protein